MGWLAASRGAGEGEPGMAGESLLTQIAGHAILGAWSGCATGEGDYCPQVIKRTKPC